MDSALSFPQSDEQNGIQSVNMSEAWDHATMLPDLCHSCWKVHKVFCNLDQNGDGVLTLEEATDGAPSTTRGWGATKIAVHVEWCKWCT